MKKYFVLLALIFSSAALFSQTSINNLSDWNAFVSRIENNQSHITDNYTLNDDIGSSGSSILTTPVPSMINGTFRGHLDGNMHKITVNITSSDVNVGLFSQINYGSIDSLIIDGSITATSANANVGGFAGSSSYSGFNHCTNLAEIIGGTSSIAGGIVGSSTGYTVFENCVNGGTITGGYAVAGIVSRYFCGVLFYCKNSGIIQSASGSNPVYMGGIVGYGDSWSGGMTIGHSINIGRILSSTSQYAGGIVAYLTGVDNAVLVVHSSLNAGIVDGGTNSVGGIVGYSFSPGGISTIHFCLNTNWISRGLSSYYGSIVGYIYGIVEGCYYDNQMCILGGIGSGGSGATGLPTSGMLGASLGYPFNSSIVWRNHSQLYPVPTMDNRVDAHPIELLAMAPIYLRNNEKVNDISTSPFTISNGDALYLQNPSSNIYGFRFQWRSFNNFISISTTTDAVSIVGTGGILRQDTLEVKLFSEPLYEKVIPIRVR